MVDVLRAEKIIGLRVGETPHRFIGLWVVVVLGRAFVRSWAVAPLGWYERSVAEPIGVLTIGNRRLRVLKACPRRKRPIGPVTR